MQNVNTNNVQYLENYIRISHTATGSYGNYTVNNNDWINFPTPSEMPYTLNDVDKDPFTDLRGFTHRNRVRTDVLTFDCNYNYLDEDTQAYVLQAIEPEWFYAEIINPKTKVKEIHKVYCSSKKTDVWLVKKDQNDNWYNQYVGFQVTMVEE